MHVPDGFLAPQTWVPAYAVSAGLWTWGVRRTRARLDAHALPQLGVMTAVAFVLMMLSIPIPGGSTIHFTGVGVLAVLFGGWSAFLCVSLVLLLQATLFGAGGMTALPVSALTMGFVGGTSAALIFRLLRRWRRRVALFSAAYVSVVMPAVLMAVVLGLQPLLGADAEGSPLYFPFGLAVTLPAVVIPHLFVGIGEGVITVLMIEALDRMHVIPRTQEQE